MLNIDTTLTTPVCSCPAGTDFCVHSCH